MRKASKLERRSLSLLLMGLGLASMAHGEGGCCGDESGVPVLGPRTGTVCPPTRALTYTGFGKPFMEKYCLRCHSESVGAQARQKAPEDHNFDFREDIASLAEHIDQAAGIGPAATNRQMPPSDPKPTDEERRQLAEWLACGAP